MSAHRHDIYCFRPSAGGPARRYAVRIFLVCDTVFVLTSLASIPRIMVSGIERRTPRVPRRWSVNLRRVVGNLRTITHHIRGKIVQLFRFELQMFVYNFVRGLARFKICDIFRPNSYAESHKFVRNFVRICTKSLYARDRARSRTKII